MIVLAVSPERPARRRPSEDVTVVGLPPLLSLLGYVQIPRDDGGRAWERRDPTAGAQWLIFTPIAAEHGFKIEVVHIP